MRRSVNLAGVSVAFAMLSATPAWAGTYAFGYGETIKEATDNANSTAAQSVNTRRKGCVGVGKDGDPNDSVIVDKDRKTGLWKVGIYYSFHAGSCGQMSDDKKLAIATAKSLTFK